MPIFEYACRDCGKRFEMFVKRSTQPACPSCHGTSLEQQLSVFAVGRKETAPSASEGACGSCGDPRGPGSCQFD